MMDIDNFWFLDLDGMAHGLLSMMMDDDGMIIFSLYQYSRTLTKFDDNSIIKKFFLFFG